MPLVAERYLELAFDLPVEGLFSYYPDAKNQAAVGKRAIAPFGRRELLGYIVAETTQPPEGLAPQSIKALKRTVDNQPLFGAAELELAKWMAAYYLCSLGEALAAMIPSGRRESVFNPFVSDELEPAVSQLKLSAEQQIALDHLSASQTDNSLFYLYGITGSGKTEVFLQAAERTIAAGRTVIYLVPEIALTHQLEAAVAQRFRGQSASLHSGMTASQRLSSWARIRRGEARLVIGPRSAVFAPTPDLGLIIIDEEHDGSYKSGNSPRYHARQVAFKRCRLAKAKLVMGSATPSLEAWKLMEDGLIHRLDLSCRLSGGSTPVVKLIDLATSDSCLSQELKAEIRSCAQAGRQTILFLNRRGFAYFFFCANCGYSLNCRHCSVALTYHKDRGRAVCHYCGYSITPPAACPDCGSLEAGFRGFGTEMIEEAVKRSFPDLRVCRVDADSVRKKGSLKAHLDDFRAGRIDVLLGTQMVAKGLNFPGVRLVGVIFADSGLQLPDFRAAERTFALIVQVAGRAGRYFPDGRVLVQTFRPHDPAVALARQLDVATFYAIELKQRAALGFPPYSRLIRVLSRSKDPEKADMAIQRLAAIAENWLPAKAEILGPAECPLATIAGNHRRHLVFRSADFASLHRAVRQSLKSYWAEKITAVYLEVDVDPVSLL